MGNDLDQLNRLLANLRQHHETLLSLVPRDRWADVKCMDDDKKKAFGAYAYIVSNEIDVVKGLIEDTHFSGTPWLTPTSQAKYFEQEVLPFANDLRDFWFRALGLDELEVDVGVNGDLDSTEPKDASWPEHRLFNDVETVIFVGVQQLEEYVEGGSFAGEFYTIDEDAYNKATKLVNSRFFQPNKWYSNLEKLRPLLVATQKVPKTVRPRLREIQESFIVGHYLSVMILCRAVLEYALFERASKYDIDVSHHNQGRRKLSDLVNDFSQKLPSIEIQMRLIKRLADNSIHLVPDSGTNVHPFPDASFANAIKCWDAIKAVLEEVYA